MSTPNIFMEDTHVGGIPWFTWSIRRWLPRNKKKREFVLWLQMSILTYITYSFFNMARRPIAVAKTAIIKECNNSEPVIFHEGPNGEIYNISNEWCNYTIFKEDIAEFMGFLDSVFILSYGVCLYFSGIIADCYNPRFYLTVGCAISGFFCALLGLTDFWGIRSLKYYSMVLILFGASQSTGWPVVLSCVTHWHSGGRRGMFFGFWNTHNYLGSVLGILIAGEWVDRNWGWAFCIPGFILAFMSIIVFLCLVADPDDLKELDEVKTTPSSVRRPAADLPQWLGGGRSITMYDALALPGVIEFSACMFFSRIVGYMFLFWIPVFVKRDIPYSTATYYLIAYVVGGSLGGITAGILVDLFRKSAVVCATFLLVSIPILVLGQISTLGENFGLDFFLLVLMGLFVEAPYIVISTTVSANLGTHRMIKRNHRALSTIGGIVEGTGAVGAAIGTGISGVFISKLIWSNIIFIMLVLQFVAALCVSRQAYQDFFKKRKRKSLKEYWRTPTIFK